MLVSTKGDLLGLLSAVHGGNWDSWLPLMDYLYEHNLLEPNNIRAKRRYTRHQRGWAPESIQKELIDGGHISWDDCPCHQEAILFQKRVAAIDLDTIAVISTERWYPERAKAVRKFFTRLRLKGASVTLGRLCVEVRLPKRSDHIYDKDRFVSRNDVAEMANRECRQKVLSILLRAFPNTDDRSDHRTDYFDNPWGIN